MGHDSDRFSPAPAEVAQAGEDILYRRRASPVEERFWLLHELNPESSVCNEGTVLWFDSSLDVTRLRSAVEDVVVSQPLLHTRYVRTDGQLFAEEVVSAPVVVCEAIEVEAEHDFEELAARRAHELTAQRFQLDCSPLLRVFLLSSEHHGHALACVFHHIVADGSAFLRIFPQQIARRYSGEDCPSAERQRDAYNRFAESSRQSEQGKQAEHDLCFWQEHLSETSPVIDLPTDRPYPQRPSSQGGRVDCVLPAETRALVAQTAEELGVRPFDVTCAAFVAQLLRYSGELELVLGAPVANRRGDDRFADTVGCFINNLVLRLAFDETPSFAEIVRAVFEERRLVRAHQSLSFGTLIDRLQLTSNPARPPLYQVMFNYLDFSLSDCLFAGVESTGSRVAVDTSMLDLSLDVTEEGEEYRLCLEYNGDVFDRPHAERMLAHYSTLLEGAIENAENPLSDLPLVPLEEMEQVVAVSRGPHVHLEESVFHETACKFSKQWSESVALSSDYSSVTYEELFSRARALARTLIDKGVRPTEYVAVVPLEDPCDTVIALLAVWYASAAFVALDLSAPRSRQLAILEDSKPALLLGSAKGIEELSECKVPTLVLDDVDFGSQTQDQELPEVDLAQPAYLIYTSGSTGKPKGVVVTHRNLVCQTAARLDYYKDVPGRIVALYSFAFDAFVGTLTLVLSTGGTWRLLDEEQRRNPTVVREIIEQEEITHLDAVPSMYRALLEGFDIDKASSLVSVICGAEVLPASLAELHWQRLPSTRLFNEYGPTEATVFATIHELNNGDVDRLVPIGKPVANYECWVVDSFGAVAPLGHAGELCVAGEGVVAGYHRRPELTEDRFVSSRLDGHVETRMYRTGDVARFRPDGLIEYIGRRDEQVQIRGYRVELGEVQAKIEGIDGVAKCAVVLREDEPGQSTLVAYLVASGNSVDTESVRAQLANEVPTYMIPAAFVSLDELPLTPNGKVDRKRLPAPVQGATVGRVGEAPENAVEGSVIEIWAKLLKYHSIGVSDNFFEIGGHSLLAVKMVDAIDREHGQKLRLVDVFRNPTPRGVAQLLEDGNRSKKNGRNGAAQVGGISPLRSLEVFVEDGPKAPLIFVGSTHQARLVATQLRPDRPIYGLNMFGLHEPGDSPDIDIPSIAKTFLSEIRTAQPHGPYCLTGYCQDGVVAYEMAQQLIAEGETVSYLGLLDCVWLLEEFIGHEHQSTRRQRAVRNLRKYGTSLVVHKIKRRIQYGWYRLKVRTGKYNRKIRERLGLSVPLVLEHRNLVGAYTEAIDAHEREPYDGIVDLYIADEWAVPAEAVRDLSKIRLHEMDGFHDRMFEGSQLVELGKTMQRDLDRAAGNGNGQGGTRSKEPNAS